MGRGATMFAIVAIGCGRVAFEQRGTSDALVDGTGPGSCVAATSGQGGGLCVVRTDGVLECWGHAHGTGSGVRGEPAEVALAGVSIAYVGENHACALAAGDLYCWGANDLGQIGDGTAVSRVLPTLAGRFPDALAVGTGQYHTCVLEQAGTVRCWGENTRGQLGDGTYADRSVPGAAVVGLADARALVVGDRVSCAIRADQSAACWGSSVMLGDGTAGHREIPGPVNLPAQVVDLSAGCDEHACAVLVDGSVWCWGNNSAGELGDGTFLPRNVPVQVQQLPDLVVEVSVGAFHTCARLRGGDVWCWGRNHAGQLGDGGSNRPRPTVAFATGDVVDLEAGCAHTCARRADDSIWCWGENIEGALGDGTFASRFEPRSSLFRCP